MGLSDTEIRARALAEVRAQLVAATAAKKCHTCGCFRRTVEAMASTTAAQGELAAPLAAASAVLTPEKYDCLGCPMCFPAIAANAFRDAFPMDSDRLDSCPAESPSERRGWPPLPGDYRVVRYRAAVAVCTLNSAELATQLASAAPEGLAIVGTLHTENLGIERLIRNVLANPHIRFLILCGEDTRQAVGHLPGQSLASLFENGLDDRGLIVRARGKRPIIKNASREQVTAFLRQVELVSLIGEVETQLVIERIHACGSRGAGVFDGAPAATDVPTVTANEPRRLTADPAGFFVVYPDPAQRRIVIEHYTTAGVLDCIVEGATPAAILAEVIERTLVSRLDHAGYLGRELGRAEHSVLTGEPYVQDRAPGEVAEAPTAPQASCVCGGACSPERAS